MQQQDRNEALAKMWALIKDVRVAMMTSWDGEWLRSRPMHGYQEEFVGELWFFTKLDSAKTREVSTYDKLNLAYADASKQTYVSVAGRGEIVVDRPLMEKYWNRMAAAWFPKGLDDPDIALIKVTVESAEYWDMTANSMRYFFEVARANISRDHTPDLGEQAKVQVR